MAVHGVLTAVLREQFRELPLENLVVPENFGALLIWWRCHPAPMAASVCSKRANGAFASRVTSLVNEIVARRGDSSMMGDSKALVRADGEVKEIRAPRSEFRLACDVSRFAAAASPNCSTAPLRPARRRITAPMRLDCLIPSFSCSYANVPKGR